MSKSIHHKKNTPEIKDKLAEKRRSRKRWQQTRHPMDKSILNKKSKELKDLVEQSQNKIFENSLRNLDSTASSDYSLWKATKALKSGVTAEHPIQKADNTWARSNLDKANTFAEHLENVFKTNPIEKPVEELVSQRLAEIHQLDLPIKKFTIGEVEAVIRSLKTNKAPGYDLVTPVMLKELPYEGLKFLTCMFNAIIRTGIMPPQWKVAQITMVLKPGKTARDVKSYRPISLLPVVSKVLETLFLSTDANCK